MTTYKFSGVSEKQKILQYAIDQLFDYYEDKRNHSQIIPCIKVICYEYLLALFHMPDLRLINQLYSLLIETKDSTNLFHYG